MLTKEQIKDILIDLQSRSDYDSIIKALEDTIYRELEIKGKLLIEAIIQDDTDGIINAFTGWDLEALLHQAKSEMIQSPEQQPSTDEDIEDSQLPDLFEPDEVDVEPEDCPWRNKLFSRSCPHYGHGLCFDSPCDPPKHLLEET